MFRAVRYEAGYSGLIGRTLVPQGLLKVPAVPAQSRATTKVY